MEPIQDSLGMLDLLACPGFCVKDKKIVKTNPAAEGLHLEPGSPVSKWLATGKKEYQQFDGGCLYLTMDIYGQMRGACVTKMGEWDIFLLDPQTQEPELQSLALAARELRDPLTSMMSLAGEFFPQAMVEAPVSRDQLSRMMRGMYQMLRIIGNMSDAERYSALSTPYMETTDITGFLDEIYEKAATLIAPTGVNLTFRNLENPLFCSIDRDMLERAVWNLLSNALKYTDRGGNIQLSLSRQGRLLRLSVQDDGEGMPDSLRAGFFHRYRRRVTFEDRRQGIGLGAALVRSVAAQHGGTVLLDQPGERGIRVTMTLALREQGDTLVRSPKLHIDYAGELDYALIELSEVLPAELYGQIGL